MMHLWGQVRWWSKSWSISRRRDKAILMQVDVDLRRSWLSGKKKKPVGWLFHAPMIAYPTSSLGENENFIIYLTLTHPDVLQHLFLNDILMFLPILTCFIRTHGYKWSMSRPLRFHWLSLRKIADNSTVNHYHWTYFASQSNNLVIDVYVSSWLCLVSTTFWAWPYSHYRQVPPPSWSLLSKSPKNCFSHLPQVYIRLAAVIIIVDLSCFTFSDITNPH